MKRLALLGAALSLVMALSVIVPGYAAQPTTLPPVALGHSKVSRPLQAGMILTISGSGTALQISNQTVTESATLMLTVKVVRASFGGAILSVTGGSLMVGSDTWTVDSGRGLLNFHSGKVLLKVSVKDNSGNTSHLVLFGKIVGHLASTIDVGNSFNVDFLSHQSKLAGKWFLDLKGATVTRTS
jgi:hypothetical protein